MKITSLLENTSRKGLPVEHGLSLLVEKDSGQKILFDMGQSGLFADNAERLSLRLDDVSVAVVSHGHYDHGGGLRRFLEINHTAQVFIHMEAFRPHYSLKETGLRFIGLDESLAASSQIRLCSDCETIGDGMMLFANVAGNCCNPLGNKLLFGPDKTSNDSFCHEQSLIIEEGKNTILLAGCAHRGIINIMRKAEETIGHAPTHVLAGMHLVHGSSDAAEEDAFIHSLARHLMHYDCKFYTMHCTGMEQFQKLRLIMGSQIEYLSCGESIEI